MTSVLLQCADVQTDRQGNDETLVHMHKVSVGHQGGSSNK